MTARGLPAWPSHRARNLHAGQGGPTPVGLLRAGTILLVAALVVGFAGWPIVPATHAASRQLDGSPAELEMRVDELTPRVVSAQTELTVRGTVRNVSDHGIRNIAIRVQRGQPQTSETQLRSTLVEAPPAVAAQSPFERITDSLPPGQSAPLELTVPLGPGGLAISAPGIYPLLINVNGQPEGAGAARLAALNTLLPVLAPPEDAGNRVRAPMPVPTSILWPIVDRRPRVISNGPSLPTVLSDDALADSLAPGGRLFSLVDAVRAEGMNSPVASSLCFAIDPGLLDTVRLMSRGYQVRNRDGGTRPGSGVDAARNWLDAVRSVTEGRCVITLPYADADLAALTRANPNDRSISDLTKLALHGDEVVQRVLEPVEPLSGVAWPAGGTLDSRTVQNLADRGTNTMVVDPTRLRELNPTVETAPMTLSGVRGPTGEGVTALPYDAVVSGALSGRAAPSSGTTATANQRSLLTQNGLAALTFRAGFSPAEPGAPVLIAPPRRWNATDDELRAMLRSVSGLATNGLVDPVPLAELRTTPAGGTTSLEYGAQDVASEVSPAAMSTVYRINHHARELFGALQDDPTNQTTPLDVIRPVQFALLRASSAAWRGGGTGAERAVRVAQGQLEALTGRVTVSTSGQISLASEDSPIPLSINNSLPVAINVRAEFSNVPGLRVTAGQVHRVPANSGISRLLGTELYRSGQFSMNVTLTTPSGVRLGPPARFELASRHYGGIMLVVTGTAGAALVLLVGLRIYRRIRSNRPSDGQQERPQR